MTKAARQGLLGRSVMLVSEMSEKTKLSLTRDPMTGRCGEVVDVVSDPPTAYM